MCKIKYTVIWVNIPGWVSQQDWARYTRVREREKEIIGAGMTAGSPLLFSTPCSEAPLWCLPSPYVREEHKCGNASQRKHFIHSSIHSSIHKCQWSSVPQSSDFITTSLTCLLGVTARQVAVNKILWTVRGYETHALTCSQTLSHTLAQASAESCSISLAASCSCFQLAGSVAGMIPFSEPVGEVISCSEHPWPYPQIIWFIHGFEWMMFCKSLKNRFSFDIFLFLFLLETFIPPVIEHLRLQTLFFSQNRNTFGLVLVPASHIPVRLTDKVPECPNL